MQIETHQISEEQAFEMPDSPFRELLCGFVTLEWTH